MNDERVHDYVAALNLITLQYGVWLSTYGDSGLNLLLVEARRAPNADGLAPCTNCLTSRDFSAVCGGFKHRRSASI